MPQSSVEGLLNEKVRLSQCQRCCCAKKLTTNVSNEACFDIKWQYCRESQKRVAKMDMSDTSLCLGSSRAFNQIVEESSGSKTKPRLATFLQLPDACCCCFKLTGKLALMLTHQSSDQAIFILILKQGSYVEYVMGLSE